MLLSQLAEALGVSFAGEDTEILSVEYDSRRVKPGSLFCCIVGFAVDGHRFAENAVKAGAVALLVERALPLSVPQLVVENARIGMAELAAAFYGHPQHDMTMVGVTGTNGKTSTTYMVKAIAEAAGRKVGLIGTIRNMIGDASIQTNHTTPESVDLFKLLAAMKAEGCDVVIMEVSSHALHQYRVHGIEFDIALFTNLTQDHLDYHGNFENYLACKRMLFQSAKLAIVNIDDPYAARIMEGLTIPIQTFGIQNPADYQAKSIEMNDKGVRFDLKTPKQEVRLQLQIPGLFSVLNALGSVAIAQNMGIDLLTSRDGLEELSCVSGRLESIPTKRDFSVFVDYAHTPDALENVLKTVRQFTKGEVICVFGCGGNRDQAKRPLMGETVGRLSDHVVITSDNPRNEDPMQIIRAAESGVIRTGTPYVIVENRRDAILAALKLAGTGDVVMVAGKGHEDYQEINGTRYRFDDRATVMELLDLLD